MTERNEVQVPDERSQRTVETAGPTLAHMLFGWDGPMWRFRHPWGPWTQGESPIQSGSFEMPDD